MEGNRLRSARHAYTSVLKDGSTIRVEISTSLIKYKGQTVVQGIVRDITEQERLQQQLQQSKKMEAIGLLAGGVAHDLNNVLSGIVSYPDLILMDLPKGSPLVEPIQTIQTSGQKAAEIVQDLLTLARRGVSTKSVLNLNDVILNYLHSPEHERLSSYHPNVSIETDMDENLLNIEGSSTQLVKSVMNLVSNAAEAQPSGGQVLITTKNQYIETPIKGYEEIEEGDFVVLGVEDSGLGIATEDLDRIFEPFYTKKVMGRSGTGLGMAVVWGTVHDHEGYINVKSTEGVGTRFTLYFPVIRAEIADRELVPVEEYLGNRETILVVDDVLEQRDIAATILSKLNYSVAAVSSGEEAVAHVKEHAVDLLILDMIMDPGIDGLETYKRTKELHPHQKAIIASGYSETHRVKEAIKLGAGKYIRKPYTLEKIGIAVRDELR
jgi:signal transduction histidine kinase